METNHGAIPRARTEQLVTREMPDEVLVYDLKNHKAHCLNQAATTVWKYCDGKLTAAEIATTITQNHQLQMDEATVWLAVKQLSKAELLNERLKKPAGNVRFGRRAALRGIGLGTALAVPVVMSIIAPTAEAACTGLSLNNAACAANATCCSTCCGGGSQAGMTCATSNSLANDQMCSASCACASMCCKSNNSGGGPGGGQDTCQNTGPSVICFP